MATGDYKIFELENLTLQRGSHPTPGTGFSAYPHRAALDPTPLPTY